MCKVSVQVYWIFWFEERLIRKWGRGRRRGDLEGARLEGGEKGCGKTLAFEGIGFNESFVVYSIDSHSKYKNNT